MESTVQDKAEKSVTEEGHGKRKLFLSMTPRKQRVLEKGQDVFKRNISPVTYFLKPSPAAKSFHPPPNSVIKLGSHQ